MTSIATNYENEMNELSEKFDKQDGIGVNKTYVPNPGVSLLFFFIITTVYFIVKFFMLPKELKPQHNIMNIISLCIYILILIVGNYFINMSVTNALCGDTPQWGTSFIITLLPWILIFAVINMVLIIYPGWLTPFSNTLGYFGAKMAGLNNLFDNILQPYNEIKELEGNDGNGNIEVAKALQQIYGNKTLLINEIPRAGANEEEQIDKFKEFIESMAKVGIFRSEFKNTKPDDNPNIQSRILGLYNLLKIKDIIAEYIWYLLSGFLVTSISYNYIVNVGCSYSSKQMKTEYDQYISKLDTNGSSSLTDSERLTKAQSLIDSTNN